MGKCIRVVNSIEHDHKQTMRPLNTSTTTLQVQFYNHGRDDGNGAGGVIATALDGNIISTRGVCFVLDVWYEKIGIPSAG